MHFKRLPCLAAFTAGVLMLPTPASAAQEDTQLWVYLNTILPVADGAAATIEVSPRARAGSEQLLTRATLDFDVADKATLGGGTAYVEYSGGHEFRLHQQANWGIGPLAVRTRLEERFFKGADRAQIRLRQRGQITLPAARDTRLSGSVEWLYILRPEDRADPARLDNWRFNLAVRHNLSPRLEAGLGYLMILSPRTGTPDRISHVPQITLVMRN